MAIRIPVLARKTHKWIGLFVGFQVVIWSLSGLYMTAVHIDTIHGDHLIRERPRLAVDAGQLADPVALAASRKAHGLRLASVRGKPAFVLTGEAGEEVLDARSGRPVPSLSTSEIRAIAMSTYAGAEPIASAELINRLPGEIRGRTPPLWRIEFDHWNKPTLYFSPTTGELITRRHELWRVFDFLWMLHIMDYDERENVNNPLLRVFTWGAVLLALSAAWLLIFSFPNKKKRKASQRP